MPWITLSRRRCQYYLEIITSDPLPSPLIQSYNTCIRPQRNRPFTRQSLSSFSKSFNLSSYLNDGRVLDLDSQLFKVLYCTSGGWRIRRLCMGLLARNFELLQLAIARIPWKLKWWGIRQCLACLFLFQTLCAIFFKIGTRVSYLAWNSTHPKNCVFQAMQLKLSGNLTLVICIAGLCNVSLVLTFGNTAHKN